MVNGNGVYVGCRDNVGFDVGDMLIPSLRLDDGWVEGAFEGCALGIADGLAEGWLLGALLGANDGSMVEGCPLGITDGCPEGCQLGSALGELLGWVLGIAEGCIEVEAKAVRDVKNFQIKIKVCLYLRSWPNRYAGVHRRLKLGQRIHWK